MNGSVSRTAAALSSGSIDINERDHEGWTPLMEAAHKGFPCVTKMLLDAGADADVAGDAGTALHVSLGGKHLGETAHLLVDAGANLEAISPSGMRPIHSAVERGLAGTTRVLIDAGADVNAETKKGKETPLLIAAAMGYVELVRMLLRAKADPLLPDCEENLGPLTRAYLQEVNNMVRHPSSVNLPLEGAAIAGHAKVVCELLQQVGIEGCGEKTGGLGALGAAAMEGHLEVMATLTAAGVVDTGGYSLGQSRRECKSGVRSVPVAAARGQNRRRESGVRQQHL